MEKNTYMKKLFNEMKLYICLTFFFHSLMLFFILKHFIYKRK